MNKITFFLIVLLSSCNTGNLTVLANLPKDLYEASGIETSPNSNNIWMLNDGGNKPQLFSLDTKGNIQHILKINAKNNDWEDLTQDKEGNIYIGDFGNNANKRKNLTILKISKDSLKNTNTVDVEHISFHYENQDKFPPKKKQLYYDCEAFFHLNDSLYLFTKSRVKDDFGKTHLYKIPAKKGNHVARLVSSFTTCNELPCWVTSADISFDGKTVVLLSLNAVWTFTNFKNDNFFSGDIAKHDLGFESQKESVCFKDSNTLYITDELVTIHGGNLYEFKLTKNN